MAVLLSLSIVLAGVATLAASGPQQQLKPAPERVIIGYVFARGGTIDPATIRADKLTHINYAFANVRDGEVVEGSVHDRENLAALTGLRRQHPSLKILISVGGWTWSGGFSDAALTPESRRKFVASAVDFVRRHDLDGFDVDWEYPGLPGIGNTHRPEDRENFTALMSELRTALDAEGAARGRRYLLTFAAGAFDEFIAHTDLASLAPVVDFVNLMTYDFRVAAADPIAGHHANLFTVPEDDKRRSADAAVRGFMAAGVPAHKLVLGVPFYGRAWVEVEPEDRGLYQPGKAPTERIDLGHGTIEQTMVGRDGFTRYWDERAQAPYLWNADRRMFVTYEDTESLRAKCRYIREHGLAGAMFWEYRHDTTGALLDTLAAGLRGRTD